MREIRKLSENHIDDYADIAFNAYPSFKNFTKEAMEEYKKVATDILNNDPQVTFYGMFEEAFNIKLSNIRQEKSPILTTIPRSTDIVSVKAGDVAGCKQLGFADLGDKLFITMEHPQQIKPEMENIETGDYITITGVPNLNLQIKPEIPGGIATIAICVNMIPLVMNATAGLKTMLDLPVPRAIIGDVRDLVKGRK